MIDYFLIYQCILEVIQEEQISDAFQLFEHLSNKKELFEMRRTLPQNTMVEVTLETLDNLIDDGLIVAKRYQTKDATLYQIDRLSTAGQSYLASLENQDIKNRVISFLKSDGLPLTPQSITKALANIFL